MENLELNGRPSVVNLRAGVNEAPVAAYATSGSEATDSEVAFSSANNLRKVSEQILSAGTTRSRSSISNPAVAIAAAVTSRPGSVALAAGSPRDQASRIPGPASIQSSSSGSDSRPGSQLSLIPPASRPPSQLSLGPRVHSPAVIGPLHADKRGPFAGPPNTLGLPHVPSNLHGPQPVGGQVGGGQQAANTSPLNLSFNQAAPLLSSNQSTPKFQSKLPRLHSTGGGVSEPFPEAGKVSSSSGGLLSTISQAALSDDESPPATHVSSPPKFNTASLARPSPRPEAGLSQLIQPNYENVQSSKSNKIPVVNGLVNQAAAPSNTAAGQSPGLIPRPMRPPAAAQDAIMTQGQFRAAASQAKVSTIPDGPGGDAYLPMGVKKGVMVPLAASSPSGIPTLLVNKQINK